MQLCHVMDWTRPIFPSPISSAVIEGEFFRIINIPSGIEFNPILARHPHAPGLDGWLALMIHQSENVPDPIAVYLSDLGLEKKIFPKYSITLAVAVRIGGH
jgi:hypothetical protein